MRLLSFALIVLAIFTSCSSTKEDEKSNSLEGLKYSISNFLSSCQSEPLEDYTTISDSLKTLTIRVPSKWDKEAFLDSTGQGVFMMDTLILIEEGLIHTVLVDILNNQTKTLPKHFADDLLGMEAEGFKIHEIGQFFIGSNKHEALWVLADLPESQTLFLYTKGPFKDKMFIASINVSLGSNSRERICQMKTILTSIQFNSNIKT